MMRRIVVTDIFGKTPALERLCKAVGGVVDILDPYDGNHVCFQAEAEAYQTFMKNTGLKAYCDLLRSRIDKAPLPATLIGFSVGASAVWRISASLSPDTVKRAVCFYGSQVRHLMEINPGIMVDYIMPIDEPGFSVDELANRLSGRKNVVVHKTPYMHGFMNELSTNYDASGYTQYIEWLRQSGG